MKLPFPVSEFGVLEREVVKVNFQQRSILRCFIDSLSIIKLPTSGSGDMVGSLIFSGYHEDFGFDEEDWYQRQLAPPAVLDGKNVTVYRYQQKEVHPLIGSYISIGVSGSGNVVSIISSFVYSATYTWLSVNFLDRLRSINRGSVLELASEHYDLADVGIGNDEALVFILPDLAWSRLDIGDMVDIYELVRVARVAVVGPEEAPEAVELRIAIRAGGYALNQSFSLAERANIKVLVFIPDPLTANSCRPLGVWGAGGVVKTEFARQRKLEELVGVSDGKYGLETSACSLPREAPAGLRKLKYSQLSSDVYSLEQSCLMAFYWCARYGDYLRDNYGWHDDAKVEINPCFYGSSVYTPCVSEFPRGLIRLGGWGKLTCPSLPDGVPDALDAAVVVHELIHYIQKQRAFLGGCDIREGAADVLARVYLDQFDFPGCHNQSTVFRFEEEVSRLLHARRRYDVDFVSSKASAPHHYGSFWGEVVWRIYTLLKLSCGLANSTKELICAHMDAEFLYVPPTRFSEKPSFGLPALNRLALAGQSRFARCLLNCLALQGVKRATLLEIKDVFLAMKLP